MSTRFDGLPEVLKNVRTRPLFVMHLNVRPLVIVGATPGVNRRVGLVPSGSFEGDRAKELGPRRIAVNTVAPGAIATDFSGGMVRDNPEQNCCWHDGTRAGRFADDIGPMIASLLSDDNRWVNAQRIEVSGGMSI
jgi:hypothetical protein